MPHSADQPTADEIAYWEQMLPSPERRSRGEYLVDAVMLQHLADELPAGGRFAELGNRIERDGGRKRMLPQTNPSAMADPHECLVSKMHRSEADEVPMRVRRMLRTLPHMEQTVLRLRYGFGGEALSQQEVADRLGVVRKTAYNIEQRALQMLRGHEHIDALRRAA